MGDTDQGYTVVVDSLPVHATTTQLLRIFGQYGKVVRVWRTQAQQGMVTFLNLDDAKASLKHQKDSPMGQGLRVTAAFYIPNEARGECWQCVLCGMMNEEATAVCRGYMCGIERREGSIDDLKESLSQEPFPSMASYGEEYYDAGGYDSYYVQPSCYDATGSYSQFDGMQDMNSGMGGGMSMNGYMMDSMMVNGMQSNGMVNGMHSNGMVNGMPPNGMVNGINSNPMMRVPCGTPTMHVPPPNSSASTDMIGSSPTHPVPSPSPLKRHCVIITNAPTDISDETLQAVFTKFSDKPITTWIRKQPRGSPRASSEGHVVYQESDHAQRAVDGQSGCVVDSEKIWCVYAKEVFVVAIVPEDPAQWGRVYSEPEGPEYMRKELRDLFSAYGTLNDVVVNNKAAYLEYFSSTSVTHAITKEDNSVRLKGNKLRVMLASSGTRWPCMNCLKINSATQLLCAGCKSSRTTFDAWAWSDRVTQVLTTDAYGDPYQGYHAGATGTVGKAHRQALKTSTAHPTDPATLEHKQQAPPPKPTPPQSLPGHAVPSKHPMPPVPPQGSEAMVPQSRPSMVDTMSYDGMKHEMMDGSWGNVPQSAMIPPSALPPAGGRAVDGRAGTMYPHNSWRSRQGMGNMGMMYNQNGHASRGGPYRDNRAGYTSAVGKGYRGPMMYRGYEEHMQG